jgi:DNA polymerase-3 subunit gamma/tau
MIKQQVGKAESPLLNRLFQLLLNQEPTVRLSNQPKLAMELAFLRMCEIQPAIPLDQLVEKLDDLQRAYGSSDSVPERPIEKKTPITDPVPDAVPEKSVEPLNQTERQTPAGETVVNPDRIWQKIIEMASEQNPFLAATLSKCNIKEMDRDRIEIEANGNDFTRNQILRPKNRAVLEKIIKEVLGKSVHIEIVRVDSNTSSLKEKRTRENQLKQEALSHPLVADAVEIFNGKVVEVKIL